MAAVEGKREETGAGVSDLTRKVRCPSMAPWVRCRPSLRAVHWLCVGGMYFVRWCMAVPGGVVVRCAAQ